MLSGPRREWAGVLIYDYDALTLVQYSITSLNKINDLPHSSAFLVSLSLRGVVIEFSVVRRKGTHVLGCSTEKQNLFPIDHFKRRLYGCRTVSIEDYLPLRTYPLYQ